MPFVFSSCVTDLGEEPRYIHFGNLQVGQESRYVRVHGYLYGDTTSNIYTIEPDTLVVRIIGKDTRGYIFEDFLTPHSRRNSMPEDTLYYTYHVSLVNDTLHVEEISHLFWGMLVPPWHAILPARDIKDRPVTITGWKMSLDPFEGAGYGYALDFAIQGQKYTRANVFYDHFYFDFCGPAGLTLVYSASFGVIRSRRVAQPTWDQGLCWDLVMK
jgi:hypothetical protein